MAHIGYARVSTREQSLDVQLERLADCEKVFREKLSGVDAERPELRKCLNYVREGDTLIVTKLDRLARSTADLYSIISDLEHKGVAFKVLDDPVIDTSSRTGKMVMGILALIAEFETDIRKERQLEGIAKAKANGVRFGRTPAISAEKAREIAERKANGESVASLAEECGVERTTIYRAINGVASAETSGQSESGEEQFEHTQA